MAIELVPFADLATLLDLSKTESDYPDLTLIQETVVEMFENHLDRSLEQDTRTETKQTFCGPIRMVKLQALPLVSVSSVTVGGSTPTTAYKIRPWGLDMDGWVRDKDIVVTYVGGLEEVPGDLRRAALLQTVYEYQNKDSIGIQTVSTEGGTTVKPELGMLKEVRRLLDKYKHPYPRF